VAQSDGDGWHECQCGSRHWGKHGAAGVLVVNPNTSKVLLQLRAPWTHGGQTWGIPGGAKDSHESDLEAALREVQEELGIAAHCLKIVHEKAFTIHGDWKYHTVVAAITEEIVFIHNEESIEAGWFALDEVDNLELHQGFASGWPQLKESLILLIADFSRTE